MKSKYQYFSDNELKCKGEKCCGGTQVMNNEFMVKLVSMRKEIGFPLVLTSAYRCKIHNESVSSTGNSGPHTTGRAVDILVRGNRAHKLIECALRHGMTGIGVSQKGPLRFIHIDDLGGPLRPWVWSY